MNDSGTGATFRSRYALILLCTTVLGAGVVAAIVSRAPTNAWLVLSAFGLTTIAQVVLIIVMSIINALTSPAEPDDERDAHIATRSTRYSVWILEVGVFFGIAALVIQQLVTQTNASAQSVWLHPLMAVHLLTIFIVASEVARYATTVLDYRTR